MPLAKYNVEKTAGICLAFALAFFAVLGSLCFAGQRWVLGINRTENRVSATRFLQTTKKAPSLFFLQ
jgi:hypothetical protein